MRKFAYDVAVSAASIFIVVVVLLAVGIATSHRLPSYDASYDYGDDSYYRDTEGRDI